MDATEKLYSSPTLCPFPPEDSMHISPWGQAIGIKSISLSEFSITFKSWIFSILAKTRGSPYWLLIVGPASHYPADKTFLPCLLPIGFCSP